MNDAIVTIQDGYFEMVEPSELDVSQTSISTFINMMLFTKPWWANPNSGSDFEDQTDGINTNETRKNIEITLGNIKAILLQENLVSQFQYGIELNAEDVFLKFQWTSIDSGLCEKMEVQY